MTSLWRLTRNRNLLKKARDSVGEIRMMDNLGAVTTEIIDILDAVIALLTGG